MGGLKAGLISSTALSAGLIVGVSHFTGDFRDVTPVREALAQNPCAARSKPCAPKANPCATKGNPCAARNPCGASANPCNPCGASAANFSKTCTVPRLVRAAAANPCAAKRSPCSAKSNPCAAKTNPCAGKSTPCAAKAKPCSPRANPCAAKSNPCAAKANPCAAKANPCAAANPCNPCSPCGAAEAVELQDKEAAAAYNCLIKEMLAAYAKSNHPIAKNYTKWPRYSLHSYQSATHGSRFVQNYANETGKAYGRFEKAGKMPAGARIAKDSFVATADGKLGVGPLFLMEKMRAGFNAESGDWKYTMIMPDGTIFGETNGKNSAGMQFCAECHAGAADNDHLMFLPVEHRVKR